MPLNYTTAIAQIVDDMTRHLAAPFSLTLPVNADNKRASINNFALNTLVNYQGTSLSLENR